MRFSSRKWIIHQNKWMSWMLVHNNTEFDTLVSYTRTFTKMKRFTRIHIRQWNDHGEFFVVWRVFTYIIREASHKNCARVGFAVGLLAGDGFRAGDGPCVYLGPQAPVNDHGWPRVTGSSDCVYMGILRVKGPSDSHQAPCLCLGPGSHIPLYIVTGAFGPGSFTRARGPDYIHSPMGNLAPYTRPRGPCYTHGQNHWDPWPKVYPCT